jgi:hypothetical protein
MNMKGSVKEGDHEGELIIDESRGVHHDTSFTTTPYNEPRPTPTPTPTCYEQIGHNFGNKPSSSTLSLLASAASKNNNSKGPQHRFHPYLRLNKEQDEFLSAYYPSSSIVHSNGIWTPSTVAMTSAPSNPSSSVYEQHSSSSPYEGYPHLPPNEQIVALTSSTSSGGEATSPFLYEHTNNNNNYHQQGEQYKNEVSSSSPPPLVSQYPSRDSPVPVDTMIKNSFFTQAQVRI